MSFGIVFARIFCAPVSQWVMAHFPSVGEGFAGEYKVHILASALIFAIVFLAFKLGAGILKSALSVLHVGVLNSLAGAAFSLLKWVMIMSLIYNVFLAIFPTGRLADYCDDGDGNLVELVMSAAPALIGTCGPDELEHMRRMEEAKSISENNVKEARSLVEIC